MINIPFNKRTPFFILEKEALHIVGQKIIHINKGFDLIQNDEILEYFLNHPEVLKSIPKKSGNKNNFQLTSWYFIFQDKVFYLNILFLLLDRSNFKKFKNIFCLHNGKLYSFDWKNLNKNYWFLFPNLSQPLYELAINLENKDIRIYYNSQLYDNVVNKILQKFQNNNFIEIFLQQNLQRFSKFKSNFLLTHENLINSQKNSIKMDIWLNLPVIHMQKIKSKSPIHKYFSAYTFTDNLHYKIIKNRGGSGGSDLLNMKNAKIKAFAEAIERHHSSYLPEDVQEAPKSFNYKLVNKIIWSKIYNHNSKSICKKSFELIWYWDNLILWDEIKIPGEIIFYPYIGNNSYFANSNGVGAGRSYEEALLSWLFELSERDSLMLMWLQKLTPKKDW